MKNDDDAPRFQFALANDQNDDCETLYWSVMCSITPRFVARARTRWTTAGGGRLDLQTSLDNLEWIDDEDVSAEEARKLKREAPRKLGEFCLKGLFIAIGEEIPTDALNEGETQEEDDFVH